jgi:3-hydroxybutyryl-CoA dehydratase
MISKLRLEDIHNGQQFIFKKIITAQLIESFSLLTGDFHPLHTREDYAKENGFDSVIAQGFLITSFLSFAVGMHIPGENALILSQESKFLHPIYVNEEITFVCEVWQVDARFSTFDLRYSVLLTNNRKAVSGNVKVKVRNDK